MAHILHHRMNYSIIPVNQNSTQKLFTIQNHSYLNYHSYKGIINLLYGRNNHPSSFLINGINDANGKKRQQVVNEYKILDDGFLQKRNETAIQVGDFVWLHGKYFQLRIKN